MNTQYLRYRLRAKLLRLLNKGVPGSVQDDFDWRVYSSHYADELKEVEQTCTTRLAPQDYRLEHGRLTLRSSVKPLHPNHRLLYETLLQLTPQSVMEMGCGGGDHLYNLAVLAPELRLYGVDRSQEQLDLLKRRSPSLKATVQAADITLPLPASLPSVEVSFTQAVIMHIHTADHHLAALANMFQAATHQVVLVENWTRHPFLDDIRRLRDQGRIPWPDLHFYFRRAPELENAPHLIVISATPLDYEPLEDYGVMR